MSFLIFFILAVYPLLISAMVLAIPLRLFGIIRTSYLLLLAPIWVPLAILAAIGFIIAILWVFYFLLFLVIF